MSSIAESAKVLDHHMHKAYVAYRRRYNVQKGLRAKDRDELFDIVSAIFEQMGKHTVESTGGLAIKGMGYFFAWLIPKKTTFRRMTKDQPIEHKFNHHTNQRIYSFVFLPKENSDFRFWSMDNKFSKGVKNRLKERIMNGFRPKGFPYSIQSFL